jgi:inosine-uridine nucleoside N-ribohydrolase
LSRTRLWIDTDIGDNPDDAIALACAVRDARTDLVGVSTVDGDVGRRAATARALLRALGKVDATTVVAGPPAAAALVDVDVLLAIGPLTNVAAIAPERLPRRVVAMGGARTVVNHRGRATEVDHNFACDPAAARLTVERVAQLVLVPLDVTVRTALDDEQTEAIMRAEPALRAPISEWRAQTGARLCLHDPFAYLVALEPTAATTTEQSLRVGDDGALHVDSTGHPRAVVDDLDVAGVVDEVLALLRAATVGD